MTTEINLPALIAELEAATEGSPALDRKIMLLDGWTQDDGSQPVSMWKAPKGRTFVLGGHGGVSAVSEVFPYTRSVDGALALVPSDKLWRVGTEAHYAATVGLQHYDGAPTPALALCIAALRSRIHNDTPLPA